MIIPFVLTIFLVNYDSHDIEVCSIEECHKEAKQFISKDIINKICFKNMPERNFKGTRKKCK